MEADEFAAGTLRSARAALAGCCTWLILGSSAASPQTLQENARDILEAGLREHSTHGNEAMNTQG
jgi:hypothetical protein